MAAKAQQWSNNAGSGIPNPPGYHSRPTQGYTPIFNGKPCMTLEEYDGKRLRKTSMRKTVDYNCSVLKYLEDRVWQRGSLDRPSLQPDVLYYPEMQPPTGYLDNPINAVCTRFVRTATNKMRCPVFCLAWTPEGRRLITGASSGEFTLWNSLTFNFETILQAHDASVRTMIWSHNDQWMVTGDHSGYVKYWQMNMNNVRMFQAHKEPVRDASFSPSDNKLVTCSDDGTVRIWDFVRCHEERVLRGHGSDVKCCDWHPYKSLVVSGSKDNQQPIRLWDPKSGTSLTTLHAHKSTVTTLRFNSNGNWMLTGSRDHLLKLYDLRKMSEELQVFRGHKKEVFCVAWHPIHETLVASGGSDGAIMFWNVGSDKEVGCIEQAHDSLVWGLSWHPLGHVLASGSNDHTSRFWTRNRPGDTMLDKYNLNVGEQQEQQAQSSAAGDSKSSHAGSAAVTTSKMAASLSDDTTGTGADTVIPGMGPADRVEPPQSASAAASAGDDPQRRGSAHPHSNLQQHNSTDQQPRYLRRPNRRFAHHWDQNWQNEWDTGGGGVETEEGAGESVRGDRDSVMTSQPPMSHNSRRPHHHHHHSQQYPGHHQDEDDSAWSQSQADDGYQRHYGNGSEDTVVDMETGTGADWDVEYHHHLHQQQQQPQQQQQQHDDYQQQRQFPARGNYAPGGYEEPEQDWYEQQQQYDQMPPVGGYEQHEQDGGGAAAHYARAMPSRGFGRAMPRRQPPPHPPHHHMQEHYGEAGDMPPPPPLPPPHQSSHGRPRGGVGWRGGRPPMRRGNVRMPGHPLAPPADPRAGPWRGGPRPRGMRPGRPRRPPVY